MKVDSAGRLDMLGRMASAAQQRWFVYMARCADGTLYTGIARDVVARIAAHDAGRGARYTRGRGPLTVCATRRCNSMSAALRLEAALKRLPRAHKARLTEHALGLLARRCSARARRPGAGNRRRSPR